MSNPNPERDERVRQREEAVCRMCDREIHLAGDEWRHNFNESIWCPPMTATPRLHETAKRTPIGIAIANNAATQMRDRCVGKVKSLADSWAKSVEDQWDERPDLSFDAAERLKAAGEIITALQSLTLEGEQEKRQW